MTLDLGKRPLYIVGAAETPLGRVLDHTELSMLALATNEAIAEAGLSLSDVDGVFCFGLGPASPVQLAEYLGLRVRYADGSDLGGGQLVAYVNHAVAAISSGLCSVALIGFASRQRSQRSRPSVWPVNGVGGFSWLEEFESPTGLPAPMGQFALVAARHMHEYGTTPEQLASVAVTARQWARLNPKAWCQDALSVDDVLSSPMIATPIHRLDMCLRTDGGGVLIVTDGARAASAVKPPVAIIGVGESESHFSSWLMSDITDWGGRRSSKAAFEMAGITGADVDVFEPYDASTISVLIQLEELGFCPPGEAGRFVEDGNIAPGGALPSLTSGGGLSYNHPGAFGLQLLIEAVRQVRGEAGERQVPDVEIGVAHGFGGMFWLSATVVLAKA